MPTKNSGNYEAQWKRMLRKLQIECGESVFNSWFGRLEFEKHFGAAIVCTVPTKFLKSWIESHFLGVLTKCVNTEFENVTQVVLQIRSAARQRPTASTTAIDDSKPGDAGQRSLFLQPSEGLSHSSWDDKPAAATTNGSSIAGAGETNALGSSPLDRRLTFDTFLTGESNQLAHAAAQRVAAEALEHSLPFNPLYIHAGVGLGKTHLLQATAHRCQELGRKVIYLTAEKFMYGFVSALKAQSAISYKEWLRTIDVLIVDDLQFLQGKTLQHEFGHTLNSLIDAGRQIIIAADRPPSQQEGIDERIRSRLSGGLCLELKPFDDDLRLRVVQARVSSARKLHPNIDIPSTVISYIASAVKTNGRDLEGAINRLIAHSTMTHTKLTVKSAEAAISDLIRMREPKRVKVEEILKLVSSHYNVSRQDILSSRRTAVVVKPRQVAMYLAKTLTLRSLPEIGRRFGGRDHTTVLHAVRKIETLTGKDAGLREEIELLKRILIEQ
ncbi:MAG: chromosomal replication initiator protein DnaA [Beijerinckiaceae bacterium]|nr:chromosomal replication initiator protein DnaA [Beijerinckiaceae bacterium]